MKNIGIINTFSHTKSTGKIAYGLYKQLRKKNNCTLFYGEPEEEVLTDDNVICLNTKFEKKLHVFESVLFGNQGEYSYKETFKLIKEIRKRNIEYLYLFNIHGYYLNYPILFHYIAKHKIKVIYTMLDEYAYMGKCCFALECDKYKYECNNCQLISDYPKSLFFDRSKHIFKLKKRLYSKISDITFVSIPYIVQRAKESALLKNHSFVELEEGIDLKNIYYPRNTEQLRKKLGIEDTKIVILLVAPFSFERKGARYFLEVARQYEQDERFVFINVGFDVDPIICPSNFIPISYVSNQEELAEYYSLADCFVCTSLAETVADTCLEALACGTPVIGFSCAGLPYSVKEKHCQFVPACDVDALCYLINNIKKKDKEIMLSCRKYAEDKFDFEHYMKSLENLIEDTIDMSE